MMYGKDMGQMSASTMRAISKKKPMVNAGAKPMTGPIRIMSGKDNPMVSKPMVGKTMPTAKVMVEAKLPSRKLLIPTPMPKKFMKKNSMGPDMSAAMDRGVRKALRMPGE